jgi:hypothetical protein
MATELHLDPELAEAVRLARRRAEEMGELPRGPFAPFESTLPPEARPVFRTTPGQGATSGHAVRAV